MVLKCYLGSRTPRSHCIWLEIHSVTIIYCVECFKMCDLIHLRWNAHLSQWQMKTRPDLSIPSSSAPASSSTNFNKFHKWGRQVESRASGANLKNVLKCLEQFGPISQIQNLNREMICSTLRRQEHLGAENDHLVRKQKNFNLYLKYINAECNILRILL